VSAPATTAELREVAAPIWATMVAHEFPRALATGVLPPERFRFYISQNLLYLPEYARMIAAAASRSPDLATLAEYTAALENIVATEIPENERLRAAIEVLTGPATELESTVMAPATVAYTSWLLSVAATGDSDDVSAALLPCAWSYGEIARALTPQVVDHPVYADWIGLFASDAYDAVVQRLRVALDRDLPSFTEAKRERLAAIFLMGCRMERQFWDQGLSGGHWPDLQA
jgi:thiaminase/transcriptional activator TenA